MAREHLPTRYGRMPLHRFASFVSGELTNDLRGHLDAFHRRVSMEIYASVLARWPVRSGFSRANWQVAVNATPSQVQGNKAQFQPRDKKGRFKKIGKTTFKRMSSSERTEAEAAMKKGPLIGKSIHIANPVDYAKIIEFGGGRGRQQKGKGAVRLAINSVMARVNSVRDTNVFVGTRGQ